MPLHGQEADIGGPGRVVEKKPLNGREARITKELERMIRRDGGHLVPVHLLDLLQAPH